MKRAERPFLLTMTLRVCSIKIDFTKERKILKISTGKEIGGKRLFILYSEKVKNRLETTCFRGVRNKFAGNFSQWNTFEDLVSDKGFDFEDELHKSVMTTLQEYSPDNTKNPRVGIVTLDFEQEIGWESTDDRCKYLDSSLEEFCPNNRCTAFRVKTDLEYIQAPKTSLMTIVYGILIENKDIIVCIQTMYPGEYVGPLHNTEGSENVNITERQGRVFFDWYHPGE
jgi:hypothetical protein